jgi:uracil-DNA glycosylase family 4
MARYETIGQLNKALAERLVAAQMEYDCLADGDINSEIVIVTEAPGPRETQLRMPLVGGSGKFLWEVLAQFGLRRQHCYTTNVVKKQLVDDMQTQKKGVSANEFSHWKALLDWELSQLPSAKYVLLLGDLALRAVTGETGIDKWRGSVLNDGVRSIIVANNPALILRKPSIEPIFRLDISKLDMVRRGQWRSYDVVAAYDPSPKDAVAWCDKMIQEAKPVSFDVEVISGETACIGMANEAHAGLCINFRGRDSNRWSTVEEVAVRRAIQRVLRHANVNLVAQNGSFDCGWLWYKDRIKARPLYIDTLLAHHTLHPTWPHNLGFLTAQYTTHPYYKDEKDAWREGGNISTFWEYNVKDCCITWEVARRLEQELKTQKMWDFYQEHVMKLQPFLVEATVLGNKVDTEMRSRLDNDFSKSVDKLEQEFIAAARIATGDAEICPNPNSPKQLAELFYTKLRLVGKGTGTDEANRIAMIENPRTSEEARKMLHLLNNYKEQHKLLSTYIKAAIDPDGRMRSEYKQYGVQNTPGRLSSSSTLWGSGMNLQNQPEQLRGMFIADRMMFDG